MYNRRMFSAHGLLCACTVKMVWTLLFYQSIGYGPMSYNRLNEIHPDYAVQAVADKRLTDDLDLSRGCGGVAIL